MKILISSDSICDLPQDILNKHDIKIIPLPITLGENTYLDGVEVTPEIIFNFVDTHKILPKTSAINEYTYTAFFEEYLKNYDKIIHFTISSKVSMCYENAEKSARNFSNVQVINSNTLSTGTGLLIMKAVNMREEGATAEEIVEKIEELKNDVYACFVIEKLDFLHKGGRCSSLQMLGANLLKIRPSILVENGALAVHKKYKGKMSEVVKNFVTDTLKESLTYDKTTCFLTYSSATPEMLQAAHEVLGELGGFENIIESRAGATITSHCGRNTLGVIYLKN